MGGGRGYILGLRCVCVCVLVGGGSAHSLSHVSVYRGASRQLLSGECPHISALFFLSLLVLSCIFISIPVTSASLCTSRSLRGALLVLFFYYHLAVTSDRDFFFWRSLFSTDSK